jgi:hypothetical protein
VLIQFLRHLKKYPSRETPVFFSATRISVKRLVKERVNGTDPFQVPEAQCH